MGGFSNKNGQSIVYADNVDFSGAQFPSNTVTANGQLLIGGTASPHLAPALLTSSGSTINYTVGQNSLSLDSALTITGDSGATVTPNGVVKFTGGAGVSINTTPGSPNLVTISLTSSGAIETITPDSPATPISPISNNFNILGQQAGTIPVMDTIGSAGTIKIENRAWTTPFIVDPSSTTGLRGTYTTIASAIAAAVSGQTIFLRPGTYTENLSLKVGVSIVAYQTDSQEPNVTISGKATLSTAGTCCFGGINFQTNGDNVFSVTGSAASVINCVNCQLISLGNDIINMASSNVGAVVQCYYCVGNINSGSGKYFAQSGGNVIFEYCNFQNAAGSTTASTTSAGICQIINSTFRQPITTSGTGGVRYNYSECNMGPENVTCLTHGGSDTNSEARFCNFFSGSATGISIGGTLEVNNCEIKSSNTNAISGAGTINFCNLSFTGTSKKISTTTQVPTVSSNDSITVVSPGAYPYTTIPQDALILVDTSSARTIIPLASPTTGQKHIIKDSVGSAAANNITVTPSGKNIDGAASSTINVNYGSITIVYNGSDWSII